MSRRAKLSSSEKNLYLALRSILCLSLSSTLLSCVALAQFTQSPPNGTTPIARLQSGSFSNGDIEKVARAGTAQEVLPKLEKRFFDPTEVNEKGIIANALVRLGDRDSTYWNFLLQQATFAVDSDIPEPFRDAQARTKRELSPEFKAWIQTHRVDISSAIMTVISDFPERILLLGETGDPRGIPLLRRALQSHNYFIVGEAANGLAKIQDIDSVPLIIRAIQGAPPEDTSELARSLVYFDDAEAQGAVDRFMPKDKAALARDSRARGMTVFGWE